jgi:DNA-directed RNA polymerase specialized sigma24 family protein
VVDGTNDGHLVTRDAADRRRFDALFEGHRFDVASYCSWQAASRSDAEDAAADVFLVAWRRIESVPSGDAARAWLYATARRVIANQRRSRRRHDALEDRLARERPLDASHAATVSTFAASAVAMSPEDATVHVALAGLSDRDREVLLLVGPVIGVPAATALIALAVATVLVFGSPNGSQQVTPAAAIDHAVSVSAAAAEQSGTVSIEVTQDGNLWGARTVRWNGSDVSITNEDPGRVRRAELIVVDGTLYGPNPEAQDGWLELGSPASIDPDSGTTPDEYLATVRADAGGDTFRRITGAMTDLTTRPGDTGSVVYSGTVPAGDFAPETGTKEGVPIRVLPYGYVAQDDASNPAARIEVRITVGADKAIQEIRATWSGASSWSYRLSFSGLGSTPAPTVPDNVESLCVLRGIPCPPPTPGG